jgi:hypothetical protein
MGPRRPPWGQASNNNGVVNNSGAGWPRSRRRRASSIHASTHSHLHVPWLSHHPIAHPITPLAGSLRLLGRCRQHRRLVEACGGCLPVERGDARDLVRRKGESPCTTTGWRSLIRGSWDPPLIMGPPCIFSPCELGIEVQQRVH